VAFAHDGSFVGVRDRDHSGAKFCNRPVHIYVLLMKLVLRRLWEGWKRVARAIGNFQARVLLTVFYVVLILPFGVAVRLLADPLRIRRPSRKWAPSNSDAIDMAAAHRQW
jgi:hypothetical protein